MTTQTIGIEIEKEIVALIKSKPFFAHFIQNMRRILTEEVETMGVNITDQINLFINPEFFNALLPCERVACLEHEVLHIINKHIIRGKGKQSDIFNIACDIAINQYITPTKNRNGQLISKLPDSALKPDDFKLPKEKTAEEYYKQLIKQAKKVNIKVLCNGGKGLKDGKSGKGQLDNHNIWNEGNGNEDYQHQVVKNALRKTIEKTKDWGSLPSNIVAEIKKALRHETVNWRSILQKFIYRATIVNTVPTRKKRNRRYGFYYDGNKVECKLNMLVAIDTSGSVSDKDMSLFFSEIEKIKALGMEILVVECDTKIHKSYRYKTQPKVVHGRGGTAFQPVFQYAKKHRPRPDCIVYLTDLYANTKFKNMSGIPTLWAITQDGDDVKKIPFGVGIKLKDDVEY